MSEIAPVAFADAHVLSYIEVHPENDYFCSENGILFNKQMNEIIRVPPNLAVTEFTISYNITRIWKYAVDRAVNILNVTFLEPPDQLLVDQVLEYRAMHYCIKLTHVVLSSSISSIGSGAFAYNPSLVSVHFPENIRSHFPGLW